MKISAKTLSLLGCLLIAVLCAVTINAEQQEQKQELSSGEVSTEVASDELDDVLRFLAKRGHASSLKSKSAPNARWRSVQRIAHHKYNLAGVKRAANIEKRKMQAFMDSLYGK